MQVPCVNFTAHWLSVVKVADSNSQVRIMQFDESLVESHPQETPVASGKLLQSEAVLNDEHYVGFAKH